MQLKVLGAALIICSCGSFGFSIARDFRRDELYLQQILQVLDYMKCELEYRLTPLPELFCHAGKQIYGSMGRILSRIGEELEQQTMPDAESCVNCVLASRWKLSAKVQTALKHLGQSLGKYDLQGQLQGIESVKMQCSRELQLMERNREERLRSYRTLGICAGIAAAIIFA